CHYVNDEEQHKKNRSTTYGQAVLHRMGNYLPLPGNLYEANESPPWKKWRGKEVMMSSTHDPYLPTLAHAARRILEHALPAGVDVCLQTRSFLVTKDIDFLS